MMGIELVLHASLLQNMGEDTRKSAKKNKNLSSKMDAQERAEELADNNFNVPDSVSDAGYSCDGENDIEINRKTIRNLINFRKT